MSQSETDFELDGKANSIGAFVMHLVATEAYYQIETLEGRKWPDEEKSLWGIGAGLNKGSKRQLKEKFMQYYLDLWNLLHQKPLAGLKTKDDTWFASEINEGMKYYWAWYHVMEHQANHMGQKH